MKCTCDRKEDCNNQDMKRCDNCIAPLWCMCRRPEVIKRLSRQLKEMPLAKGAKEMKA